MMRWTRMASLGISLMLMGMVIGCEEPVKEPPPPVRDDAADRIADLQRQLAQAMQDRAANDARLAAMQSELDRLRNQPPPAPPPAPAPQGWTAVPGGAMIALEGTVLFDSGKTVLKPSGTQALQAIADTIQSKYADHDIFIYGHTDNEPIRKSGWKDNYELSCQRALSVLRFFKGQGLQEPIAACGWGEDRPVASNSSAAARQANRRVEVYAMAPKQGGSPPSNNSGGGGGGGGRSE